MCESRKESMNLEIKDTTLYIIRCFADESPISYKKLLNEYPYFDVVKNKEHLIINSLEELISEKAIENISDSNDLKLGTFILSSSAKITSNDPLVDFLYMLMRDHVPFGVVENLLTQTKIFTGTTQYENTHLASYAIDVAKKLKQ